MLECIESLCLPTSFIFTTGEEYTVFTRMRRSHWFMDTDLKNNATLGLGCWALGGDQWGSQGDGDSLATIQRALDEGIVHFDTAQAYGNGHGKELLGKALHHVRDKVFIASKIFYKSKEKVEAAVAVSLKRLQTDRIDLMYIHWPKKNGDLAGMMEALENCRRKNMIRRIGISNFSTAQAAEVMKAGTIDVWQFCWNLLWRREEREAVPFCREHGIGMVTYSSLAEGILIGKFGSAVEFAPGDHRKYTVLFEKDVWPEVCAAVEKLKIIAADDARRPLAHLALRWLLAREGVMTVLVGSRSPEQVSENCRSLEGGIDPAIWGRMEEVVEKLAPHIPAAGNIFKWYP